jgi:hypothetical protein
MSPTSDLKDIRKPIWPYFPKVSILIVMDGVAGSTHYATFGVGDQNPDPSSGDAFFGLSEVVATLTSGGLFSAFTVTKAHRDTDVRGAADIEHFRFDQHALSGYDEIWLIGVAPEASASSPLRGAELGALGAFMNGGGGVFATGDHEDLGVLLCGSVPRVRAMRKWYFPNPGPNGEPVAPPSIGVDRIETTQPGHNETFVHFDDQSDDIPQPLTLRYYTYEQTVFWSRAYPHPLMCGPAGAIVTFPDHMHEGEVVVPADLNATLTVNGQPFVEFPSLNGAQPSPEIVAWGKVLGETNTSTEGAHSGDPWNVANARSFGVVGAYDGHLAGVGRVAVDSTWHHFFDLNLIGDPIAPAPKNQGFNASASGQAALSQIQAYYRNIGHWLARPSTQAHLFPAAAWVALHTQPLNMIVNARRDYDFKEILQIGALGLQNIRRFVPPCTITIWNWRWIEYVAGPGPVPLPDPWAGPGDPVIDPEIVSQALLGGAVVELARSRPIFRDLDSHALAEAARQAVRRGSVSALRALGGEMSRYGAGLSETARALRSLNPEGPAR